MPLRRILLSLAAAFGLGLGSVALATPAAGNGKGSGSITSLQITPGTAVLTVGHNQSFKADALLGSGNPHPAHPQWSAPQGGTITQEGRFTAPASPGTYGVQADLQGLTASASVTVVSAPDATITVPPIVTQGAAGLTASVPNQPGSIYAWTAAYGSIVSGASGPVATFAAPSVGTLQLKCRVTNAAGDSTQSVVTVQVVPPPQILSFTVSRSIITVGDAITAQLSFINGQGDLEPGVGAVASGASVALQPTQSAVYTLTVTNAAGTSVAASQSVTVVPPPDATLTVPSAVTTGLSGFQASVPNQPGSAYAWTISNGTLATSNAPQVTFTAGTAGSLQIGCTVTNAAGRAAAGTRTLPVLPMPVITAFSAAPSVITLGATSTLSLQFQNGNGRVDPALGPVTPGSLVVKPLATTTYILTVDNGAGGVATQNAVVTVVPPPDPTITAEKIETQGTAGHLATVPDAQGSTFAWTVTGGQIMAGQGTRQLSYTAGTGATVALQCIVTNAAGTSATGTSTVQLVAPPDSTLTVPAMVTTGATGLNAAVPDQPGCTFAWTVNGGALAAGDRTHAITFTAGAVGILHVACTVTNAAGTASTGAQDIQVVAAPSIQAFTATPATLSVGQASTLAFTFSGGTGSIDQGLGVVQSGVSMGVMPAAATTYTLSVTNPAGAVATQSVTVTVNASTPGSVVFNTPSQVRLTLAGTYQFLAHIIGTGGHPPALRGTVAQATTSQPVVVWSVQEPGGGSIDGGFYTAPMTPGTYHVVATNSLDATKFAIATVMVIAPNPAISISVAPGSTATGINTPITLSALVQGTANQAVDWTLQGRTGATLAAQGNQAAFQASVSGAYTIRVTSQADPSKSVEAFVNVNGPGAPVINSFTTSLPSIPAGASTTLSWSITGATTITVDGLNVTGQTSESVKPSASYDYLLVATNAAGSSFAQVHVDVQAPTIQLFTADQTSVPLDGTVNLTAYFFNGQGQIDQGVGPVTSGVPVPVKPNGNTTYTLTVMNSLGASTQQALPIVVTLAGDFSENALMTFKTSDALMRSVPLYDGRVFTFQDPVRDPTGYSNLYDPVHDQSMVGPTLAPTGGISRTFPPAALMTDGRVLFGEAYTVNSTTGQWAAQWNIYDPVSNAITTLNGGPIVDRHALVPLLDGRVLMTSGIAAPTSVGFSVSGSSVFDPTVLSGVGTDASAAWKPVTGDQGIVWGSDWSQGHPVLLQDGRVLLLEGAASEPSPQYRVGMFDPSTNQIAIIGQLDPVLDPSWTDIDPAKPGYQLSEYALPDGRVLFMGVAGGWMGIWTFPVAIFDPSTNALTRTPGPLRGRVTGAFSPQMLPNGVLAYLGSAWGQMGDANAYDPARRAFFALGPGLGVPAITSTSWDQQQPAVVMSDGRIYWPGFEAYDPTSPTGYVPGHIHLFTPAFDLTITPWTATTNVGIPVQFKATTKDGNPASWSASGGTIDPASGIFKAGTPGLYVVTATDDQGRVAHARAQVNPPIVAQVSPSVASVPTRSTFQFGAHLFNTPNQAVTWSVVEGATGGSIDPQTGLYTAPAAIGVYHVMATSVLDPTASATAEVDVVPITVGINPSFLELLPGTAFKVAATTNAGGVTWSFTGGPIGTDGSFTAPGAGGTYQVVATSALDTTISASANVVVLGVSLVVAPNPAYVALGGIYHFTASASYGGVNWSVVEASGGSMLDNNGTYQAPTVAGTYTVKVTSIADVTKSATASVIVAPINNPGNGGGGGSAPAPTAAGVLVSPMLQSMKAGTYEGFTAQVFGAPDSILVWSIDGNPTTAAINSSTGLFTASTPGNYVIRATSATNSMLTGTGVMIVTSGVDPVPSVPAALNRSSYTMTALKDGRVLIAGGTDGGSTIYADCYLYDPTAKTFMQTGSMSVPRAAHQATLLDDGRVLLSCGYGTWQFSGMNAPVTGEEAFAEVYNPATGQCESLPNQPGQNFPGGTFEVHRAGAVSAKAGNGNALLIGSGDMNGPTLISLFDHQTGLFSLINNAAAGQLATPKFGWRPAATTLKDGRVLITGGDIWSDGGNNPDFAIKREAWIYAPDQTGAWNLSPAGTMTDRRAGHTETLLPDGRVLIVGGYDHNSISGLYLPVYSPVATAEIFDPATGTFTATGSMRWPRAEHAAILLPTGQVMVVGGWSSMTKDSNSQYFYQYPTISEIYDPDSGTWKVDQDFGYGISEPQLVLAGDTRQVMISGLQISGAAVAAGSIQRSAQLRSSSKFQSASSPNPQGGTGFFLNGFVLELKSLRLLTNQGFERYLNDENTSTGDPDPQYSWKKNVPRIAGRPTLIHGAMEFNYPLTEKVQESLHLNIRVNSPGKTTICQTGIDTSNSRDLGLLTPINAVKLDPSLVQAGATLTIIPDADHTIWGTNYDSSITINPKWTPHSPLNIVLLPVNYIENDTVRNVNITSNIAAHLSDVQNLLLAMFPESSVNVTIGPTLTYTVNNQLGSDGKPLSPPIDVTEPITDPTKPPVVPAYNSILNSVGAFWQKAGSPKDTYYQAIIPYDSGIGYRNYHGIGGLGKVPTSSSQPFSYSFTIETYDSQTGAPADYLYQPYYSDIPHELGHNHGLSHAPTAGPSSIPLAGVDPQFPYLNGGLGYQPFWNIDADKWVTATDSTGYVDVMGYRFPHWSSDYFFTKTFQWEEALNPTPPAQVSVSKAPLSKLNLAQAGPKVTPVASISLTGAFGTDGVPYLTDVNYTKNKAHESIHMPNSDSSYWIELSTYNGTKQAFPLSLAFTADGGGPDTWGTTIPYSGEWKSITYYKGSHRIGVEKKLSLSPMLKSQTSSPIKVLTSQDGLLAFKADNPPSFDYQVWVSDDDGNTWTPEPYEQKIPRPSEHIFTISPDHLTHRDTLRIRIYGFFGLQSTAWEFAYPQLPVTNSHRPEDILIQLNRSVSIKPTSCQ